MEVVNKPKRPPLTPEQRQRRAERARLLKSLIYEMWDGKPVYYAGYEDIIKEKNTRANYEFEFTPGNSGCQISWVSDEFY